MCAGVRARALDVGERRDQTLWVPRVGWRHYAVASSSGGASVPPTRRTVCVSQFRASENGILRRIAQEGLNIATDIYAEFLTTFETIDEKLEFSAEPNTAEEMLGALVQAATAKCVEFNIAANRNPTRDAPAMMLMSTLRGVTEDLICLTYLLGLKGELRKRLIALLLNENLAKGIDVQREFFEANNPLQPVLGGGSDSGSTSTRADQAKKDVKAFWTAAGHKRAPTVRDMAAKVGLDSTYEFIYFATSNFVHFNPSALLRMGWGGTTGPFTFSIENINAYYRNFASFYGAILFIGFEASFGLEHFSEDVGGEVKRLIALVGEVQRWPEVITFEEMNMQPPFYLMTHALREVMAGENDSSLAYGAILKELQGLSTGNAGDA